MKAIRLPRLRAGLLIDETHTSRLEAFQRFSKIGRLEANVVNAGAALREESAYRTCIACRLEELNPALSDWNHSHPDTLVLHGLEFPTLRPRPSRQKARALSIDSTATPRCSTIICLRGIRPGWLSPVGLGKVGRL